MERISGIALWRQIAQALEADIASGVYPPGAQLPTESQLAERFGVNRHTLRRAIGHLQAANQVRVEQGRGMFVQTDPVPVPMGGMQPTGLDDSHGQGRLIRGATIRADASIGRALGVGAGGPVVLIELLHLADGRPVTITAHHLAADRFAGLIEAFKETGTLGAALKRFGVGTCICKRTKVSARMPTAADARHLHMPRSQPVVVAESLNVDEAGQPVDYTVTRSAGQRMQLVFEP